MSAEETETWKAQALLWERRSTALRGIVDMLLEATEHGARHTTDPVGCLVRQKAIRDAFVAMMARAELVGGVGSEEFKARILGEMQRRFEGVRDTFNAEMKARGISTSFEDVLGAAPPPPEPPLPRMPPWTAEKSEQLADYFLEIYEHTTEQDANDVLLRAMGVYRSFVAHARSGGQVKFVKEGAPERTLKVRLR